MSEGQCNPTILTFKAALLRRVASQNDTIQEIPFVAHLTFKKYKLISPDIEINKASFL